MAQQSTHIKKLQAKIFRGQPDGGNGGDNGKDDDKPARSNTESPSLTINIPNSALNDSSQPAPVPPKMKPEAATRVEQESTPTFRQRLVDRLGSEYRGAERFRLDQDGRKELHWKQWGPYLSDRQWVRRRFLLFAATCAA